ncbi:MAG: hypothetical protein GY757_36455, partial [bacterium]|nr:hypothetical protein [bacterium]
MFFILPFFVWLLVAMNWVTVLLVQFVTLSLFAAGSTHWTGPVQKRRMLLEAMWENSGFGIVYKRRGVYRFGIWSLVFSCLMLSLAALLGLYYGSDWTSWTSFWLSLAESIGIFSFLPLAFNIFLSVIVYVILTGCAAVLIVSLRWGEYRWIRCRQLLLMWAGFGTLIFVFIFAISGLSVVDWPSFWALMVTAFDIFPYFPSKVGMILSLLLYIEIIVIPVSLLVGFRQGKDKWRRALTVFGRCTAGCLSFAIIVLSIWGLYWIGLERILAIFGIFSSFPLVINTALSGAIYLSLSGGLVILLWGMKQSYGRREWGYNLFRYLTVFCAGVVVVTLVGWGLYEFAGHLSRILALFIILALVVMMVYLFRALIREATPLIGQALELIGIGRSRRLAGFGADEWKEELGGLEPNYQA